MKSVYALAITAILLTSCREKTEIKTTTVEQTVVKKPVEVSGTDTLCFLKVVSRDSIKLRFVRKNDSVEGIFHWLPYEKDKKIMNFTGRVSGNVATVIGNTSAEGMDYKEELIFTLTDTTAAVKFGEMTENDNGVWMYRNKKMTSEEVLRKINCN